MPLFRRQRPPADEGPPILDLIAAWKDGPPPPLPDEPPDDGRTLRWSAGALDGVAARHVEPEDEATRSAALAELIEHAADGDPVARRALYDAARGEGIVFALDDALDSLARSGIDADPVAQLGRRMLREARHREPLKLAISLLGRAGDGRDVGTLETLARHDEFSLVAGVALATLLDDAVAAWWRVGRLAKGWGKVEAVGRLAAEEQLPDEVRGWLLRHGCENAVMPEYLAHACATAGRLEEALDGLVDDALLDGACVILSALASGGPVEDMSDYEPGPRVAVAVLDLLAARAPSLTRLWAALDLRNWAEDYEQHVAIAERCGRLLGREEARRFVATRLERPEEVVRVWGVAEAMGLDPWEPGRRHLEHNPHDSSLYFQLARTRDPERWAQLAAFAERALPLDALASGPEDRLFPAEPHREAALALGFLVQDMSEERWSAPLVAAALLSPVISTRNAALTALEAAGPAVWGAAVEAALRHLAAEEPTGEVLERARDQLARLSVA